MTKTNTPEIYMLHKSYTKFYKRLNLSKLSVDLMVDPVAE